MSSPGITGSGELEVLVTERSALPATAVEAEAVLLPSSESFPAATVAVLTTCGPAVTSGSTFTTSVNTTLPGANEATEHVTASLVPTGGVVHVQPPGDDSETKVVSGGSGSVTVTDVASVLPVL